MSGSSQNLKEFKNRLAYEKKLRSIWEYFQANGNVDDGEFLKPEVLTSWKKCRAAGLDPCTSPNNFRLSETEFFLRVEDNKEYIEAVCSILEVFAKSIDSSGFRFDLFDADLYLLTQVGEEKAIQRARYLGIVPGISRQETISGTTAVNLANEFKRPVQLLGPEHYNANLHCLTCSSTPIFSPSGKYCGILSMSGDLSLFHKHTLGLVVSLGKLIEQHMRHKEMIRELHFSREYLNNIINAISDGIIVIDNNGAITGINRSAEDLFSFDAKETVGAPIDKIFGRSNVLSEVLHLGHSIRDSEITLEKDHQSYKFIANIKKISVEENSEGIIGIFKPLSSAKSLIKKAAGLKAYFTFEDLIGENEQFLRVINLAKNAAKIQTTVLLQGESGTGKEVFAQALHNASQWKKGPFVSVNCAAVPGELIESELFGYESGAFTGARKEGRQGKFELAENGTIFLDEISSMSLSMQAKLLRVLQTKRVIRLGGNDEILVNVRLICASNRNLWELVKESSFREDLFYRVNVLSLDIPPLRERPEDIPLLVQYFTRLLSMRMNINIGISEEALELMCAYPWPGNVRELENVIERSIVIASSQGSREVDLANVLTYQGIQKYSKGRNSTPRKEYDGNSEDAFTLQDKEVEAIRQALNLSRRNITQAAKLLGISRPTLYRKIKNYEIRV